LNLSKVRAKPVTIEQKQQSSMAEYNTQMLRRASYSPDMVLPDFWLFHKQKMQMKWTIFQSKEDLHNSTDQLHANATTK